MFSPNSSNPSKRASKFSYAHLEPRHLLATIAFENGVVDIKSIAGSDGIGSSVEARQIGNEVRFIENEGYGTEGTTLLAVNAAEIIEVNFSGSNSNDLFAWRTDGLQNLEAINFTGSNGNDIFYIDQILQDDVAIFAHGGDGNDTLGRYFLGDGIVNSEFSIFCLLYTSPSPRD